MRVLITGGAGFIGSHSAETLIAHGHDVRIFDNLSSGSLDHMSGLRSKAEFVLGDILDTGALRAAMRNCDAVLHLAAAVSVCESVRDPAKTHEVNATGTLNVLEAARHTGIDRVVLASSAAVYGLTPSHPLEEVMATASPLSPYAAQKAMGETYARLYADLYEMRPIALRYFNVFGPRQDPRSPYSGVLSRFVAAAIAGEPVTIFGDGRQTRDFIFVRDVAHANMLALRAPAGCFGETINIGTGSAKSLLDAHGQLDRIFGGQLPPPRFEPARAGDIRHSLANIEKAKLMLSFRPTASFEEGLRDTVTWIGNTRGLPGTSLYLA